MTGKEKRKEELRLATAIEREAQKSINKGLPVSSVDEIFGEFKPEIVTMAKTKQPDVAAEAG